MYQYKELYTIDFTNINYYYDVHFTIRDSLDFPDYYGCNWDALWDCLTDMAGNDPIHIEIIGLDVVEQKFGDTAEKLIGILRDFKHCYDDEYVDDIRIEIVSGDVRVALQ